MTVRIKEVFSGFPFHFGGFCASSGSALIPTTSCQDNGIEKFLPNLEKFTFIDPDRK
jgi:hypothetical protein